MLQALGKLQIMGGIVSLSFHSSGKQRVAPFQRCFWAFVGFLFLNSIYPTVLFVFPSENWARVGAAVLDAIFDVAYTGTYLIMTVLATYELGLDQDISGNFGDQAAVNFRATLDPSFAFPTDFFGFFAVFYSLAHVCTVCRAVERHRPQPQQDPRHPRSSTPQSWSPTTRRCCKVLYSPVLLVAILWLLLTADAYPRPSGCFPCHCIQLPTGLKKLTSCSLAGVLHFEDVSLSNQTIASVAPDAFNFRRSSGIQRLSLSGNPFKVLPKKMFEPLNGLQLLDLGRLGLEHVESETFVGLENLSILSLSQNDLRYLPEDLLYRMPALEQLLLGGKRDERGKQIVRGNYLDGVLPSDLLKHSPCLTVLDLSENQLESLPATMFAKQPLLQSVDLGNNHLSELPPEVFAGLSSLHRSTCSSTVSVSCLPKCLQGSAA
ncbi:unnamed protein product [Durusdinium trenchii]|uniref:Uncharacterized protein n=1 Tax=Durusdinium trenchii TaxID=1381693 RepID=A0ABP0KVN9_9DINO